MKSILETDTHKIEIPDSAILVSVRAPTRVISVDDFIDRIPLAAYETITNHPSNEAKTFVSMLNSRSDIPLDNDKTVYYVGQMLDTGLITQIEHDFILT